VTTEFWVGIVFWCIGKDCGMITTRNTFASKAECRVEVDKMERRLREEPTKKDIIDGRCSDHKVNFDRRREFML